MATGLLHPDWPAPARVQGLVTTRSFGDMKGEEGRARLRGRLPAEPKWLRQMHGTAVVEASGAASGAAADASFTRDKDIVCAVTAADCMPVLLADDGGEVVAVAHAGWRGLAAGVIEATVDAMGLPAERVLAWLGPAIGPGAYEIGEEVRAAFLARDPRSDAAFSPTRPAHWHLDLYTIARQRLAARGIARVYGGRWCTFSDPARFFSWRRDRTAARMAAVIWLA